MRGNQVLHLGPQLDGKTLNTVGAFANQHQAERDVTHEVSVARIAGRSALIAELLKLADVVKNDSGQDEILIGIVRPSDETSDLRHLRDVLEKSTTVGVMDLLRGRPDSQLRLVVEHNPVEQDA